MDVDQRVKQRRTCKNRRAIVRFGDALGRRSGHDRRKGGHSLKRIKDSLNVFLRGNV